VGLVIFQLVTVRPNSVVIFSFDSQTVSATPKRYMVSYKTGSIKYSSLNY